MLEGITGLRREERGIFRQNLLFDLCKSGLCLVTLEHFLELDARRQGTNDTGILHVIFVFPENIACTGNEHTLLRVSLRTIPPASDDVWQKHAKQATIDQQNVLPIPFGYDELGQGDTDAETLLAVGMTILDVVITDLLVRQGFIRLGDLDEALIQGLDGLVLRGIRFNLVGVIDKGETLVVSRNGSLVGTLRYT